MDNELIDLDFLCNQLYLAVGDAYVPIPQRALGLAAVCREMHEMNKRVGWWSDLTTGQPKQRNVGELLMLAVSEVCEIPVVDTYKILDDKLPKRLMVEVELADFAIRLFDTAGALFPENIVCAYIYASPDALVGELEGNTAKFHELVRCIGAAMEGHRKSAKHPKFDLPAFDYWIVRAITLCFRVGRAMALDVPAAIVEKTEFNCSRLDHKPEARKAADGKKY